MLIAAEKVSGGIWMGGDTWQYRACMARIEERTPMTTNQPRTLISTAEAAARIGVAEITMRLWRWRDNPHQPPYVRVGANRIRYDVAALDAWTASRTHKPGSKAGGKTLRAKTRKPRR